MFVLINDKRFAAVSDLGQNSAVESIEPRKIKVTDGGLEIAFDAVVYNADEDKRNKVTYSFDSGIKPHEDLTNCFNRLRPHFGLISEYYNRSEKWLVKSMESGEVTPEAEKIVVRQVQFKGKGNDDIDRGVMMFGIRKLDNKKSIPFGTPLVKLDDSKSDYEYSVALDRCMDDLKDELKLYLGGKQEVIKQQEIGFQEDEEGSGEPKEKVA